MLSDELVKLRVDLDIALAKLAPKRVGVDLAQCVGFQGLTYGILFLIRESLCVPCLRSSSFVELNVERSDWRYESTLGAVLLVVKALLKFT